MSGGEGTVYPIHGNKALKVYDDYNAEIARKLRDCVSSNVYVEVSAVAVPPINLAYDSSNRVCGYTMRLLKDFMSVDDMTNLGYCIKNRVTIRQVAILFVRLHEALQWIHAQGFLVGDYRGPNIMFKPLKRGEDGVWQIAHLDVDSWAVNRGGVVYPCSAIHDDVMHPELVAAGNLKGLSVRHDWYAFALLLATALLKCDPLEKGCYSGYSSSERRKRGVTCWDTAVQKSSSDELHDVRFGPLVINTLKSWLAGQEYGIFPKQVLMDLVQNLTRCSDCGLEFHKSMKSCPRCSKALYYDLSDFKGNFGRRW
jgi:hypothetical protein